jgi:hypothetical protein
MSRTCSVGLIGGLVLTLAGLLVHVEMAPVLRQGTNSEMSSPLAARYHLRGRTSGFYSRARPGGGPTMKKSN